MDALGDLLAPYSHEIGKIAGTITTLQFLSAIFLLNDIRKRGSADAYPPEPFIGGTVLTILGLKLGNVMNDAPMIRVNVIGFGINVVFTVIFYWYCSSEFRTKIWKKIAIGGVFTMACLGYANLEDPEKIEFRFGLLITGILMMLVGTPLLHLNKIIEKKSTEGMPFPIILSGTMVAASWAIYGISIKNTVVIYQNLLLLSLSSIQLSMFAIYPNTNNGPKGATKAKTSSSPSKSSLGKKKD